DQVLGELVDRVVLEKEGQDGQREDRTDPHADDVHCGRQARPPSRSLPPDIRYARFPTRMKPTTMQCTTDWMFMILLALPFVSCIRVSYSAAPLSPPISPTSCPDWT